MYSLCHFAKSSAHWELPKLYWTLLYCLQFTSANVQRLQTQLLEIAGDFPRLLIKLKKRKLIHNQEIESKNFVRVFLKIHVPQSFKLLLFLYDKFTVQYTDFKIYVDSSPILMSEKKFKNTSRLKWNHDLLNSQFPMWAAKT